MFGSLLLGVTDRDWTQKSRPTGSAFLFLMPTRHAWLCHQTWRRHCGIAHTPRGDLTVLQSFENEDMFDRRVGDWLVTIALMRLNCNVNA